MAIVEDALKLPDNERFRLIEVLWESMREEPDAMGLTPEQRDQLDRRIADYRANPDDWRPWREVIDEIRRRCA